MVTGDNRLTAAKIAEESGVDDFLAEATPERKLALIREEQAEGRLVAMTGDGTNDAPALAQADVGVAMNTGTQAAREAGNMVDLDSNPTKLIEIVEVGKQLLITRGALTTFSIANDVAKYFAILPAVFVATYAATPGGKGPLHVLNIMNLGTPQSAIVSAIIFNAIVIPLLIPLSLQGRALPADRRERAAAAQPVDLRARRDHRAVHRHQADRPDRPQPARSMSAERVARLASALPWPMAAGDQTPGPAEGLHRDGGGRRQDLPHAARGPRRAGGRSRRRDRPARDARARRDRGGSPRACRSSRAGACATARRCSRRWTCRRS